MLFTFEASCNCGCACLVAASRLATFFQFGTTVMPDAIIVGVYFNASNELYTEFNNSAHYHTGTSSGLADNQWHHVVLTYTASTGTQGVYIDGVFKGCVRCGCCILLQYTVLLSRCARFWADCTSQVRRV